jgi:hypothetical protein
MKNGARLVRLVIRDETDTAEEMTAGNKLRG